jgi:arabinose-5-phosphate isomerase
MVENQNLKIRKAKKILNLFSQTIANIQVNGNFCVAIDLIKNSSSKIITTGMGKAGIAMQKFSSTLCSLGFPSCFLHPGEAMHGDMGLIKSDDILFVASTSGKTREVLELIDLVKSNGVDKIIAITSHRDSPLREKVDVILDMGKIKEGGDIGMAPTTSILTILAITDALAIIASEEKGFSRKDFGRYHHGGYLGAVSREDNVIH